LHNTFIKLPFCPTKKIAAKQKLLKFQKPDKMGFEEVIEENKRALEERNRFKRMHLTTTATSQVQK
jgi:hypothetical protein